MGKPLANDPEFQRLLSGADQVDLVRLLLEFAADAYPQLEPRACMDAIDELAENARTRLQRIGPAVADRLEALSGFLYEDEGFHGNHEDYYDPRNSYLNEVVARRRGIPITLAVLYQRVAAGVGIQLHGVPAPGHFVLGCRTENGVLYVDAFHGGDVLSAEQCLERVEKQLGQEGIVDRSHLRPASCREIAVRILRNMKAAYAMADRWQEALPVQQRLALLLPQSIDEARDLGLIYLRVQRPAEALPLLEAYLGVCNEEQATEVRPYVRAARRVMAEMN